MNYEQATHLLLIHGTGTCDAAGETVVLADGFLGMLRPYRGLQEQNFHVVMEAILVVGTEIHTAESVDRELIVTLWSTCSRMRQWGLHPRGMLQRNKLINADDTRRLETWIDAFELAALGVLSGHPLHYHVEHYAQYIIDFGPGDNIAFFVPVMQRVLDDPKMSDPSVVAQALGTLGRIASSALPSLYAANKRTYPDYCDSQSHETIAHAIQQIEGDTKNRNNHTLQPT